MLRRLFASSAALDHDGEQGVPGVSPERRVVPDSYILPPAPAEYPLTDCLAGALRGEALLEEGVSDVSGYARPGGAVYLGLKLR